MAKSIEYKIGLKTAIMYIIVALSVAAMILYLNNLRKNIAVHRLEIENQHTILSVTNDLMYAVNNAQSQSIFYLSTKNTKYLNEYIQLMDVIENLFDEIIVLKPNEEEKLHRIKILLRKQAQSIRELNIQFAERNPVELINERLQDYEPYFKEDTLYVSNIQRDTVITKSHSKGFFKRLSEAFRPSKDSIQIIEKQWIDTLTMMVSDTLSIIYEVGDIAQQVQKAYERNMKLIEKQVSKLISFDQSIALEVSNLLLDFHQETLDATLSIIDSSEERIQRNYIYSSIGGGVALLLILVFIGLIITDINKGRAARQALEKANERMRQIMESRHKLLLSVSHDIKSPLNSILGYLALMEGDTNVRSMQNSSKHILVMLENLLEFSNFEQGMLQKSTSDFNLHDLFSSIYDMFLPLADQKKLTLSFTADNIRIHTDRMKLEQIVINLVSNAVKYTPYGAVEYSAIFDKNELKITIKDTGVGIPVEKLPQLFTPFNRIEENNALANGTGLGLFIVKGLVELLGGEIVINSKLEEGTTFILTIPVERSVKEIPQGVKRITVYDDEPVIVKMVSDMLLRLGHKVVDHDYDLILTDMEMGDISGLDILQQAAGAVPVVVMTGRADFSTQKATELGFDQFLAKPFTIESLREIVGDGEPLNDFFGDNREEILQLFRTSAEDNFLILKQALVDNDFKQAQSTCHKMFPMFAQMGYPTDELRKMDAHRDKEYEGWQEDVQRVVGIRL
jgi:signal transduction histidine kinase